MFIINREYVLIGPEFKVGIQPAILYKDYLKITKDYVPQVEECIQPDMRCIDMWEALNDNFYFSNVEESLKSIMSIYFWVAEKTNSINLVPEPLLGLASQADYKCDIFMAKMISVDLSKVDLSKSRDVYFSSLDGFPYKIVVEKDFSASCFISQYVPNLISKVGLDDFKYTLKLVVQHIEKLASQYNFLHGKTHIGHVTQDGKFIDYGDSFGLREVNLLCEYMKGILPPSLYELASKKAKLYDVDVSAACTLLEIYRFIDSVKEYDELIPDMKKWIIKVLTKYFKSEESIFTLMKEDDFGFDGGCEPSFGELPLYAPIKDKFPTHYFIKKFF
jgi:hypothetical protein